VVGRDRNRSVLPATAAVTPCFEGLARAEAPCGAHDAAIRLLRKQRRSHGRAAARGV